MTASPPLVPENLKTDYTDFGIAITQEVFNMAPGPEREEKRSKTYPGIARAMAEQWG